MTFYKEKTLSYLPWVLTCPIQQEILQPTDFYLYTKVQVNKLTDGSVNELIHNIFADKPTTTNTDVIYYNYNFDLS